MSIAEQWTQQVSQAKATLQFARIQVSARQWRIIQYDGFGFRGEQRIPQCRFRFVSGSLSWRDADALLIDLVTGVKKPDYEGEW